MGFFNRRRDDKLMQLLLSTMQDIKQTLDKEGKAMATGNQNLTDAIARLTGTVNNLKTATDSHNQTVTDEVNSVKQAIATLQDQINSGSVDPAVLSQTVDAINASIDAINGSAQTVVQASATLQAETQAVAGGQPNPPAPPAPPAPAATAGPGATGTGPNAAPVAGAPTPNPNAAGNVQRDPTTGMPTRPNPAPQDAGAAGPNKGGSNR